ncbi:hypothetical protein F511_08019 [Dorcoceras hygrometricum]|uniref:Uncharacterized protein n=1 Tax=Dorcoceras hygrometricum TaxID=472368 RepID=A0A2Z7D062_9LAMI|nr:hypothetical protein F511_08019 [Dorcoceras hygrometricum]
MAYSSVHADPISLNQCARLAGNGRPASGHCAAISRDHRAAARAGVAPPHTAAAGGCDSNKFFFFQFQICRSRCNSGNKRIEGSEPDIIIPLLAYGGGSGSHFSGAQRKSKISPESAAVDPPIRSTTGFNLPPSICTIRLDGFCHGRNQLIAVIETGPIMKRAADGGGTRRHTAACEVVERGGRALRDTASRGPRTIAALKSQFRTCPSDHGKAPSNIAP